MIFYFINEDTLTRAKNLKEIIADAAKLIEHIEYINKKKRSYAM